MVKELAQRLSDPFLVLAPLGHRVFLNEPLNNCVVLGQDSLMEEELVSDTLSR